MVDLVKSLRQNPVNIIITFADYQDIYLWYCDYFLALLNKDNEKPAAQDWLSWYVRIKSLSWVNESQHNCCKGCNNYSYTWRHSSTSKNLWTYPAKAPFHLTSPSLHSTEYHSKRVGSNGQLDHGSSHTFSFWCEQYLTQLTTELEQLFLEVCSNCKSYEFNEVNTQHCWTLSLNSYHQQ